jgi:hypothetical protein
MFSLTATGAEDRGFEYRQGASFLLGKKRSDAVVYID